MTTTRLHRCAGGRRHPLNPRGLQAISAPTPLHLPASVRSTTANHGIVSERRRDSWSTSLPVNSTVPPRKCGEPHQHDPLRWREGRVARIGHSQRVEDEAHREIERTKREQPEAGHARTAIEPAHDGNHHERQIEEFVPAQVVEAEMRERVSRGQLRQSPSPSIDLSDVGLGAGGGQTDREREPSDRSWMVMGQASRHSSDHEGDREHVRRHVHVGASRAFIDGRRVSAEEECDRR